MKNKVSQNQHVSSVDTLVITIKIFKSILKEQGIDKNSYILTDFNVTTGTSPIEIIDNIKVKFNVENLKNIFHLNGIIGNMKIDCKFKNNNENRSNEINDYKKLKIILLIFILIQMIQ